MFHCSLRSKFLLSTARLGPSIHKWPLPGRSSLQGEGVKHNSPTFPRYYFSRASTAQSQQVAMSSQQMISGNRMRRKLDEAQGPSFGAWQAIPSPQISRAFAESGYDWVVVDCEHGDIADKDMREIVRVLADNNVSPIVRIPDMQGWMIKRRSDRFRVDPRDTIHQAKLDIAG